MIKMSSALTALALIAKRTASSARSEVILGSRAFSIAPIPKPGRGPPVTDPDDVVRKPDDLRRLNRTGAESIVRKRSRMELFSESDNWNLTPILFIIPVQAWQASL